MALEREDQRDVDRDAGGDRLLDRGQARLRGGDLDEQVRAVDERVQALGLLDRALGVVGEARVDLERDPAVAGVLAGLVPLRAQDVAGAADVLDGEREEDLLGLGLVLEHLAQLLVVGVALGDRRLEDRRVRGDAVDALAHERLRGRRPGRTVRDRKSIQTLCPWAESWFSGVSGMVPPSGGRGNSWGRHQRMPRGHPLVGYPRRRAANGRCQRARPASSRSQAATACSSRRASRRRAARAWLAVTELVRGTVVAGARRRRGRRSPSRRGRSVAVRLPSKAVSIARRHIPAAAGRTRTNWFIVRAVERTRPAVLHSAAQRPIRACVTGMPKRCLGVGQARVLAVVAVALGVGEDDDAVGRRTWRGRPAARPPARSRRCRPAASTPASSSRSTVSSWARVGLGDRLVGVRDPERELGLVRGGGDDEHLGALDLVAEGRAQQVGVDGFGREDEQLHRRPGRTRTAGAVPSRSRGRRR